VPPEFMARHFLFRQMPFLLAIYGAACVPATAWAQNFGEIKGLKLA